MNFKDVYYQNELKKMKNFFTKIIFKLLPMSQNKNKYSMPFKKSIKPKNLIGKKIIKNYMFM